MHWQEKVLGENWLFASYDLNILLWSLQLYNVYVWRFFATYFNISNFAHSLFLKDWIFDNTYNSDLILDKNCNSTPIMHSKLTLALKIYSSRCKAYYSIGHKTQDTTNSIIMHTVINSVFIYQSLSQHGQRTYDFLCNLNLCFFLPVNNLARTFRGPNFTELS